MKLTSRSDYSLHCLKKSLELRNAGLNISGPAISLLLYKRAASNLDRCWRIARIVLSDGRENVWNEQAVRDVYRLNHYADHQLVQADPAVHAATSPRMNEVQETVQAFIEALKPGKRGAST